MELPKPNTKRTIQSKLTGHPKAFVIRTKDDESAMDKWKNITHTFALVFHNSYPSVNWKLQWIVPHVQ